MEISQTAKLLYALLLDRSTLSQKNEWQDDEGRIYIIHKCSSVALCIADKVRIISARHKQERDFRVISAQLFENI